MMKKALIVIIVVLSCIQANAQTLTGVVYDNETKQPIPDVYVFIGGTQIIDITTNSGQFSLTIQQMIVNPKLVLSHISYNTLIIDDPFNNLPDTIYMEEQVNALEEVTVSARRNIVRDTTVSISNILDVQELLNKQSYNSLSEMIKGQIAGVNIFDNGVPFDGVSGGVSVRIRGQTAFAPDVVNKEPLVVVDGVPIGTLNEANTMVNVNNIKSIEVIKNGAGWGARGAFGVILIKTR